MGRCPFAEWIPSPFFTPGRDRAVSTRIVHTTTTTMAGALATFGIGSSRRVSAHFIVGLDGRIVQCVDTDDTAWAAMEANAFSVNTEHVDDGDWADAIRTPELYASSARLQRWIGTRYDLPPDDNTIEPHDRYVATACPDGLDVARIIAETGGTDVVTQAQWDAHIADDTNTANAIKAVLARLAHHTHGEAVLPASIRRELAAAERHIARMAARPAPKKVRRKIRTRAQVRAGHGR